MIFIIATVVFCLLFHESACFNEASDLAGSIWDDACHVSYQWNCNDKCIEHPTFHEGSTKVYTLCARAMARALDDPRMTPEVEEQMLFNYNTNIPPSDCVSILEFSRYMKRMK